MKIVMIGIGDIAQKAYLPILSTIEGVELWLCSRNEVVLRECLHKYKSIHCTTDLDVLIEEGLDAAFVHAATEVHPEICYKLLSNRIPTYVDKPVGYQFETIRELYALAKSQDVFFKVGFNRRYVPKLKSLRGDDTYDMIQYEKNRVFTPALPRTFIYDDFIHVVDTLLHLMSEPVHHFWVKGFYQDKKLIGVSLQLYGAKRSAVGIMHRNAGITEESITVIGNGEKRVLKNLDALEILRDGQKTVYFTDPWVPILTRRGFKSIVDAFLEQVSKNNGYQETSEKDLQTHELCEAIVKRLE